MAARTGITILACALCGPGVAVVEAASDVPALAFPTKPIRLIVPTSPGGGVDIVARAIGQRLTESWGQPVVIDNRSGAAGTIGAELAARAAPDGHTLLICTSAVLTIQPHLYSKLRYNTLRDFAPVTVASSSPFLLVVHPSLQPRTVKELMALAKARPGQLNYSSSGNGSVTHLAAVLFNTVAGVTTVHIPTRARLQRSPTCLPGSYRCAFPQRCPFCHSSGQESCVPSPSRA